MACLNIGPYRNGLLWSQKRTDEKRETGWSPTSTQSGWWLGVGKAEHLIRGGQGMSLSLSLRTCSQSFCTLAQSARHAVVYFPVTGGPLWCDDTTHQLVWREANSPSRWPVSSPPRRRASCSCPSRVGCGKLCCSSHLDRSRSSKVCNIVPLRPTEDSPRTNKVRNTSDTLGGFWSSTVCAFAYLNTAGSRQCPDG